MAEVARLGTELPHERRSLPNMRGLVPRAAWGARLARDRVPLVVAQVKGCSVHYTGANADEQAKHARCAARVRAVQDFHMDERGWLDIAYSFVVCLHGSIFVGRGWWTRSAANGTNAGNDAFVAVCFLGNDTDGRDDVTRAGRAAFGRVFGRFNEWYGFRPQLRPHSAFVATECPGDELRRFIAAA